MRLLTSFVFGAVLATSILFGSQRIVDNVYLPAGVPRVTPKASFEDTVKPCNNGSKRPTGACASHISSLGRMSSFECTMAGGDAYFCVFEGLGFCVKPRGNVVTANMQNGECLRLGRSRQ